MLGRGEAEGNAGVPVQRGVLARRVVGRAVAHGHVALLDRILHAEGRHKLAGPVDLELDTAVGHGSEHLGEAGDVGADARRRLRKGRRDVPLDAALRDGGCCQAGGGGKTGAAGEKSPAFHGSSQG